MIIINVPFVFYIYLNLDAIEDARDSKKNNCPKTDYKLISRKLRILHCLHIYAQIDTESKRFLHIVGRTIISTNQSSKPHIL